jgi:hypothetical protein
MKNLQTYEEFLNESKMPDKFIGNDDIVYLKTKDISGGGAHYNLYYKGHEIELGGVNVKDENRLKQFADSYILSIQLYNKLKYEKEKQLPKF